VSVNKLGWQALEDGANPVDSGALADGRQAVAERRVLSAEQTVYILHPQACLDSGIDLRNCRFSLALDNGIDLDEWTEDVALIVDVVGAFEQTRLKPLGPTLWPLRDRSQQPHANEQVP